METLFIITHYTGAAKESHCIRLHDQIFIRRERHGKTRVSKTRNHLKFLTFHFVCRLLTDDGPGAPAKNEGITAISPWQGNTDGPRG